MNPAGNAIAAYHAAASLPGRARNGRPARITARAATATAIATAAAIWAAGTPAAPAIEAATALWWIVTSHPELAPAPQGQR